MDSRERFEAWAKTRFNSVGGRVYLLRKDTDGVYMSSRTLDAYIGWQAACSEMEQPQPDRSVETPSLSWLGDPPYNEE